MSEYLCIKEVAGLLSVSVKWAYLHQEEIPGRIKICGLIRFDKKILLEELENLAKQPGRTPRLNDRHGLS